MKSILYSILWIVAGVALTFSTFYLTIMCNMFSWTPELNGDTLLFALATSASMVSIIWLARKTISHLTIITSLLVCVVLAILGIYGFIEFHSEALSSSFLGRRVLSPEWFRITILMIFLTPLIIWSCYPFRYFKKSRKS